MYASRSAVDFTVRWQVAGTLGRYIWRSSNILAVPIEHDPLLDTEESRGLDTCHAVASAAGNEAFGCNVRYCRAPSGEASWTA